MKLRQFDILLISFVLLLALAAFLIWLFPPSGLARHKRVKQSLGLEYGREGVVLTEQGKSPMALLQYAPIKDTLKYKIQLKQSTDYTIEGERQNVETQLSVILMMKEQKDQPDQVYLSFSDFHIQVFDNKKEIPLSSIDSLMAGIVLEESFSPTLGVGKTMPFVKINPQVGRILYYLSDIARQVWVPLPNQEIGKGAAWTFVENSPEKKLCLKRVVKSKFVSSSTDILELQHSSNVFRTHCDVSNKKISKSKLLTYGEGSGQVRVSLENAIVIHASGETQFLGEASSSNEKEPTSTQEIKTLFEIDLIES